MKILVLNCGSSSIKYALYNMDDKSVMTSGGAERVGLDGAFVKVKLANGEKRQIMHDIPEHTEGVKFIFSLLTDPEIGRSGSSRVLTRLMQWVTVWCMVARSSTSPSSSPTRC